MEEGGGGGGKPALVGADHMGRAQHVCRGEYAGAPYDACAGLAICLLAMLD